jgi:hypothetical protein
LSTSSPTLQYWFATGRGTRGRDPYFLYAAGNAGSLLGLLAYPVIIEPNLNLEGQARLFSGGYLLLVLLSAACAARRAPTDEPDVSGAEPDEGVEPVTWADRRRWLTWSFVPSALLLGVTRHLTTDVMSVPMLWIAPLVLYLLTFIIAFGRRPERSVSIGARGLQIASIPLLITMLGVSTSLGLVIVLHLVAFFFAALLGHSRLAQSRPAPAHLTEFYLMISIGGAVGGAVTSLVAPVIFPTVMEYPLAIVAALAMCPGLARRVDWKRPDVRTVVSAIAVGIVLVLALSVRGRGEPEQLAITALVLGLGAIVAFKAARSPKGFAAAMAVFLGVSILPATGTLVTDRSFFGVSTVKVDDHGIHQLLSGSTLHGLQDTDSEDPLRQLSYYTPVGPIGRYLSSGRPDRPLDIGILGLGSGALAGYGRTGDHLTYYEIDPAVVRIAQNPRYFSYLAKTPADVDIVLGDGRLTLRRSGATHDILMLDAFSSDAIPVHLLTREAFTEYLERISPDGIIAVHISNRYFNLEPVLTRLAGDLGLAGIVNRFEPTAKQHAADAAQPTNWVFLARNPSALAAAAAQPGWKPLDPDNAGPAWTDSFSNILDVLEPS